MPPGCDPAAWIGLEPATHRGCIRFELIRRGAARAVGSLRLPSKPQRVAAALLCACALVACDRPPQRPPLAPASATPSQAEALNGMNELAGTRFAGWLWRYQFGSGCVLRIERRFDGRVQSLDDHGLAGHRISVVPYATGGFGVKAYPPSNAGSVDVFDAPAQDTAEAFAQDARRLIDRCS
jgi:hypothetical protein